MSLTICFSDLGNNVALNCSNPIVGGFEPLGLITAYDNLDFTSIVLDGTNHRIITTLALKANKKWAAIYNPTRTPKPFEGTKDEMVVDGILPMFNKTMNFIVPLRGAGVAEEIIEPLARGSRFVALLQSKDHVGDGSFPIIGYETGLISATLERDNVTGAWSVSMVEENAPSAEVVLFDTNFATSKAAFDTHALNVY